MSDVLKDVLKDVHKDVLKELTERQLVILETICTSPNVTQQGMSTKLKVSKKTIQREFDAIRNLGINIDRQDGRKEGEWVIKTEK
jgi:ATP-dependent DNA helicase RecG